MFKLNNEKTEFVTGFTQGFTKAINFYVKVAQVGIPAARLTLVTCNALVKVGTSPVFKQIVEEAGMNLGNAFYDAIHNITNGVVGEFNEEELKDLGTEIKQHSDEFDKAIKELKGIYGNDTGSSDEELQ